jgi:hypothetical protein
VLVREVPKHMKLSKTTYSSHKTMATGSPNSVAYRQLQLSFQQMTGFLLEEPSSKSEKTNVELHICIRSS